VTELVDGEKDSNQEANDEEKQEKRLQEGIGIPHVVINHNNVCDRPLYDLILDTGKLPPPEEVCNVKTVMT
jgi:glutaredoxin